MYGMGEELDVHERLIGRTGAYILPLQDMIQYLQFDSRYEIQPDRLETGDHLGSGYFGDVYMGTFSHPNGKMHVAVKKPKQTGSWEIEEIEDVPSLRNVLRDELLIMIHLQAQSGGHENVLRLIGAITTNRTDFCLLTEYCEWGTMDCFLRNKFTEGNFLNEFISGYVSVTNGTIWLSQRDSTWEEDFGKRRESGQITTSDILWFTLQIARAMQFLSVQKVVHRDVALRNVLLKSDFTLKVADFGLSRKLDDSEEAHVFVRHMAFPIRYMSPETWYIQRHDISFPTFTMQSKYWSFGIVVWELFTFAKAAPYSAEFGEEFSVHLLEGFLSTGQRLTLPKTVPKQLENLVMELWDQDPQLRPSFETCKKILCQELIQSCKKMAMKVLKKEDFDKHVEEAGLAIATAAAAATAAIATEPQQLNEPPVSRVRRFFKKTLNKFKKNDNKTEKEPCTTIGQSRPKQNLEETGEWPIRYKVEEELGSGAFGIVYKCRAEKDASNIFVAKEARGQSSIIIEAAQNEIRQLQKITHPRVIKYFGYQIRAQKITIFMEYMAAGTLKDMLRKRGTIDETTSMTFTEQILDGLTYIHNKGIIHCDLKCDNILIDGNENIKIGDFGVAVQKRLNSINESFFINTNSIKKCGHVRYLAPEQIISSQKDETIGCSRRSDIWSFGCIIVEMLTGKMPYASKSDIGYLCDIVSNSLSFDPNELVPDASEKMKQFLSLLLQVEKDKRPLSANEATDYFQQIFFP